MIADRREGKAGLQHLACLITLETTYGSDIKLPIQTRYHLGKSTRSHHRITVQKEDVLSSADYNSLVTRIGIPTVVLISNDPSLRKLSLYGSGTAITGCVINHDQFILYVLRHVLNGFQTGQQQIPRVIADDGNREVHGMTILSFDCTKHEFIAGPSPEWQ